MLANFLVAMVLMVMMANVSSHTFTLTSSDKEFVEGAYIPDDYTCAGLGVSPPLEWSHAPSKTKQFLITRTNIYDTHYDLTRYDWVVYDIDDSVSEIPADGSLKVGKLGGCSPGVEYIYRSSCSQGPGDKLVTFTVHALDTDLASKIKSGKTCDANGGNWRTYFIPVRYRSHILSPSLSMSPLTSHRQLRHWPEHLRLCGRKEDDLRLGQFKFVLLWLLL